MCFESPPLGETEGGGAGEIPPRTTLFCILLGFRVYLTKRNRPNTPKTNNKSLHIVGAVPCTPQALGAGFAFRVWNRVRLRAARRFLAAGP